MRLSGILSGIPFVLSAPSGAGKTTLRRLLLRRVNGLKYSVSVTTRPRRPKEKHGKDYWFVSEERFRHMQRTGGLAEWAKVHGFFYGTPWRFLENCLRGGKDVILDLDIQGGMALKRRFPRTVLVFIAPPSMKSLNLRLRRRHEDSQETILRRLAAARKEISAIPRYDYLIVNRRRQDAMTQLKSVILAERLRCHNGQACPPWRDTRRAAVSAG